MFTLNDAKLYHIHVLKDKSNKPNKHSNKWELGNKLIFGEQSSCNMNLLFERVFHPYINIEWEKEMLMQLIKKRIILNEKKQIRDVNANYYQQGIINKYLQLTREIIFEEVRKALFPDKPSRLCGIWLTDDENLGTWLRVMPNKQFPQKLFLVNFIGNAHKADGRWITQVSLSFDKIYKSSIGYWSGKLFSNRGKPHFEFICTGSIEIIREIS